MAVFELWHYCVEVFCGSECDLPLQTPRGHHAPYAGARQAVQSVGPVAQQPCRERRVGELVGTSLGGESDTK